MRWNGIANTTLFFVAHSDGDVSSYIDVEVFEFDKSQSLGRGYQC